jgi:hypothetical protein
MVSLGHNRQIKLGILSPLGLPRELTNRHQSARHRRERRFLRKEKAESRQWLKDKMKMGGGRRKEYHCELRGVKFAGGRFDALKIGQRQLLAHLYKGTLWISNAISEI